MQHYTLTLFTKTDNYYELRILDNEQKALFTSQPIAQGTVDPLLKLAESQYSSTAPDLIQQGQALFNWVDQHSDGWLRAVRQTPQHMALNIDMDTAGLRHLPWELLHDGNQFLCADPLHLFTPLRRTASTKHEWQAEKQQLSVLFMASSPENIEPVLDFEAEEAGILNAAAKNPLELHVEESGSLEGLQQHLTESETEPHIIHLSGHADVHDNQPVFLLEDEIGKPAPATPEQLARTLLEADRHPRMLFLSGCRTGQSSHQRNMLSYSDQLVKAGVPIVLGWALPVGDIAASQAAAALYKKLATGFEIALAVAYSRQQLLENNSPYWHLLRCYVDHSPLNALVSKGRLRVRSYNTQQQFLDSGGRVPVCARTQFVGRRRLLQRCLRVLKSWHGQPNYAEGILLHGMGGLGKSSAAARLLERLRASHEPVICYGGLDETALITALGKALPDAQGLLNDAKQTLEQRLRNLFAVEHNTYTSKPLLLIFDDFEQNIPLQQRIQGNIDYSPASTTTLHTVLQAIHNNQSDTRVIVTSRFQLTLPQPCRLHAETPETLRAADLNKKLAQLTALQVQPSLNTETDDHAELRAQAIKLAAGNPRLLEWLNNVLQDTNIDTTALLDKLAETEQDFREQVLISELVDAQTSAARHSLACAALYQLPISITAIEALTQNTDTIQHLQAAACLGMLEITPTAEHQHYFVSNLLDSALTEQLSESDRQQLAGKASQYLYQETQDGRSETMANEIVRLAVMGKEQNIAVEVADTLASNMLFNYRYREAESLCLLVLLLGLPITHKSCVTRYGLQNVEANNYKRLVRVFHESIFFWVTKTNEDNVKFR